MAFLLPNLSPSLLLQSKSKEKPFIHHQTLPPAKPNSPSLSSLSLSSSVTSLRTPSVEKSGAQDNSPKDAQDKKQQQQQQQNNRDEFYVNLGLAVRTLREDLPLIFTKDLNYDIYRSFSHLGL